MFTDFTLYPNGAFMLSEDASEYDTNVETTPINLDRAREELSVDNTTDEPVAYDPVLHLTNKLGKIYQRMKNEVSSIDMDPDDKNTAINDLIRLSDLSNDIIERLTMQICKVDSLVRNIDTILGSPVTQYAHTILSNLEFIKKNMLYNFSRPRYDSSYGIANCDRWSYERLLNSIMSQYDRLITVPVANDLLGSAQITVDIDTLAELFTDPQKVSASTMELADTTNIERVVNQLDYTLCSDEASRSKCELNCISKYKRVIAQSIYDMKCRIIDDETIAENEYRTLISSVIYTLYAIFTITVLRTVPEAYSIKSTIAQHNVVKSVVHSILRNVSTS